MATKVQVTQRYDEASYQHLYQKGFRAGRRFEKKRFLPVLRDMHATYMEGYDAYEQLMRDHRAWGLYAILFGQLSVIGAYFLGQYLG